MKKKFKNKIANKIVSFIQSRLSYFRNPIIIIQGISMLLDFSKIFSIRWQTVAAWRVLKNQIS